MMPRVSEMWVLVRGRRVSLLRVRESDRGLMFPKDHRDRAKAIRAKARVGARARQDR